MEFNQRKSGAILSYIAIIINTLIQLIYTPFLVHFLGKSEYGLYSLVASIFGYLTIFDLGFGNAIIVFGSKYKAENKIAEEQKLLGMFNVVFRVIGVIMALAGIVLSLCSNIMFKNTMTSVELHKMQIMLLILSFNLMITFSFNIYNSIIVLNERFSFQKIVSIICTLLRPLLMIPLLFFGFKSIALCLVITIINILNIAMNFYYSRIKLNVSVKYSGFDKKIFKVIIGYSLWIFICTIVDKVNWSVDNFILGAEVGTSGVAVYSIAATINQLFINLSTALSNVFLPKISKLVAKNASDQVLTDEFIKVGRIQFYVIFLMCSGLILFGKVFIRLWAGSEFNDSYYVALLLIIPVCIPLIQNLGLSIMQAKNKFKFKAISTLVMSLFNILISIFLAKKYGAMGAAVGTSISLIICNIIITNIYYYKKINIDILKFWYNILKISVPLVFPIVITILFNKIIILTGYIFLIINVILYTLLYFIFVYFFSMNSYEKNLLGGIFAKIFKRR